LKTTQFRSLKINKKKGRQRKVGEASRVGGGGELVEGRGGHKRKLS